MRPPDSRVTAAGAVPSPLRVCIVHLAYDGYARSWRQPLPTALATSTARWSASASPPACCPMTLSGGWRWSYDWPGRRCCCRASRPISSKLRRECRLRELAPQSAATRRRWTIVTQLASAVCWLLAGHLLRGLARCSPAWPGGWLRSTPGDAVAGRAAHQDRCALRATHTAPGSVVLSTGVARRTTVVTVVAFHIGRRRWRRGSVAGDAACASFSQSCTRVT